MHVELNLRTASGNSSSSLEDSAIISGPRKFQKLDKIKKKDTPDPVDLIADEHDSKLILGKLRVIEGFTIVANIAIGTT